MADTTIRIDVDASGAQRGARVVRRSLNDIDGAAERTSRGLGALKAAFAGVSVAAVSFEVSRAIGVFADFQQSISSLSAITGAAGEDLKFYSEAAKELGRTSTLTASQVAEAFKLIASAKPDLLDNAEALKAVTAQAITLAEAAGITVPDAANALGNSLNQFAADAEDAGRFINVLAAGAKFGASAITDTTLALKVVGPVASNAGVSFEEINAQIQSLAAVGLKGAEAGTALRNVILRLSDGADATNPEVVGLTQALRNLDQQSLSTSERIKLFGLENVSAAGALIEAADASDVLTQKLTGTDTAAEQAATNTDNLRGDIARLKSAYEGLQITIGENANSGVRGAVQGLTEILSDPATQEGLASLVSGAVTLADYGVRAAAGIGAMANAVGELAAEFDLQQEQQSGFEVFLLAINPLAKVFALRQAVIGRETRKAAEAASEYGGVLDILDPTFMGFVDGLATGQGVMQRFGTETELSGEALLSYGQSAGEAAIKTGTLASATSNLSKEAADARKTIDEQISQTRTQIDLIEAGIPIQEAAIRAQLMAKGVDQERIEELLRLNGVIDAHKTAQDNAKSSTDEAAKSASSYADELVRLQARMDEALRTSARDFTIKMGLEFDDDALLDLGRQFEGLDNIQSALQGLGDTGEEAFSKMVSAAKRFTAATKLSEIQDSFIGPKSLKQQREESQAVFSAYAGGAAEALAGLQTMTTEGSAAYKVLGAASAAAAVASAASAPFPANLALIPAMISLMSSLGFGVGGGGFTAGALDAPQGGGIAQGGTVLGNPGAESESVANAIDQLAEINTIGLKYTEQMAASLSNIEQALAGVASEFARVAQAPGIQSFGVTGTVGDFSGGLSEQFRGRTVTSDMTNQDLARLANGAGQGGEILLAQFIEIRDGLIELAGDPRTQRAIDTINGNIERTFDSIGDGMTAAIETLGGDAAEAIKQFEAQGIDLTLLEQEDIDDAINALFSGIADNAADIANAALPDIDIEDYQQVGEGLFETLVRVASGFEVVNTELGRVGQALDGIDVDASENLIRLAGGIDEFVSAQNDYIDAIFTDAQKLEVLQGDVDRAFENIGDTVVDYVNEMFREGNFDSIGAIQSVLEQFGQGIPESAEDFKALVDGIDLSTEAGQRLYTQLIEIAPEFAELRDQLDAQAEAAREAAAALAESARSFDEAFGIRQIKERLIDPLAEVGLTLSEVESAALGGRAGLAELFSGLTEAQKAGLEPFTNIILGLIPAAEQAASAVQRVAVDFDSLTERLLVAQGATDQLRQLRRQQEIEALTAQIRSPIGAGGIVDANAVAANQQIFAALNMLQRIFAAEDATRAQQEAAQNNRQRPIFPSNPSAPTGPTGPTQSDLAAEFLQGIGLLPSDLQNALSAVGMTVDAFADAGFSLDEWAAGLTEAQKASLEPFASQILNLIPAIEQIEDVADDTSDAFRRVSTSIRDYLDDLAVSEFGVGTPLERLEAAQSQFDTLLAAARGGDIDAAGQLTGASDTLLSLAREVFASSGGFRDIFENVTGGLGSVATMFDPDNQFVTASSSSQFMMGPQQNNTEVVRELRSLRQDMQRMDQTVVVRVVTPDGKLIKEETIKDIKTRTRNGEGMFYEAGMIKRAAR